MNETKQYNPYRVGIEPQHDRVLVRSAERSKKRIVIPETVDGSSLMKNNKVEVVAVGPGRIEFGAEIKPKVKVGDIVVMHPTSKGMPITGDDGETYYLVNNVEIMAILRKESDANHAQLSKINFLS